MMQQGKQSHLDADNLIPGVTHFKNTTTTMTNKMRGIAPQPIQTELLIYSMIADSFLSP
jgi:hypothetical protein